jgi:methyl-accepting chemotaxis protein
MWRLDDFRKLFRYNKSLKVKLILGLFIMVSLMLLVALSLFMMFNYQLNKLDEMVRNTITANDITKPLKEISGQLSNYFVFHKSDDAKDIHANLSQIKINLSSLKKHITYEPGAGSVTALQGLVQMYAETVNEAVQNGATMENSNGKLAEINQLGSFVRDSAQKLITVELDHYHILKTELEKQKSQVGIVLLIFIVLIVSSSLIGATLYLNHIAGSISRLAIAAQNIADGDLRVGEIRVKSNDEIATLSRSFNKMIINLHELIGRISICSVEVAGSADLLKSSAIQSSKISEQIALTIQELAHGAAEQSVESQKTVQVVNLLYEGDQKILQDALEVTKKAEEANNAAIVGDEKVSGLIEQIRIIEDEFFMIKSVTDNLQQRSEEIGRILEMITEMSEKTNLLSLNASIEAARAGENGRGFAVVASEIRKLAEGSSQAVNNISSLLNEIQDQTQQVVGLMATGVEKVQTGSKMIADSRVVFTRIVETSKTADFRVKNITNSIQEMVAEIKKVEMMSESIAAIAEESSAGSQEVAASVEEQTAGLEEISNSAFKLADMAETLQNMVMQFKL